MGIHLLLMWELQWETLLGLQWDFPWAAELDCPQCMWELKWGLASGCLPHTSELQWAEE